MGVFPNLSKDSQPGSACDVYYINHIVFKFLIKSLIFALDLLSIGSGKVFKNPASGFRSSKQIYKIKYEILKIKYFISHLIALRPALDHL